MCAIVVALNQDHDRREERSLSRNGYERALPQICLESLMAISKSRSWTPDLYSWCSISPFWTTSSSALASCEGVYELYLILRPSGYVQVDAEMPKAPTCQYKHSSRGFILP